MGLLAPLFLLGLAGLVVPILVHLTERQRRQVVDFPSLMFLRKIPFRSSQRKKIHHWVLLSIRALALALLVAAFSRPFFENDVVGITSTLGPREVVVVLDRSYSMGYGDRWAAWLYCQFCFPIWLAPVAIVVCPWSTAV